MPESNVTKLDGTPAVITPTTDAIEYADRGRGNAAQRSISRSLRFICILAAVAALYFGRDLFIPITLAFLLAFTFSPIVRALDNFGIPAGLSAVLISISLLLVFVTLFYVISYPLSDWVSRGPQIAYEIERKFGDLLAPLQMVAEAEQQVEEATRSTAKDVQRVTVEGPGLFTSAANSIFSGLTTFVIVMVLFTFLLASGDMFFTKLVKAFDTLTDKKRALNVAKTVERTVSSYLLTITAINICLGITIGTGLYLLGMPTPFVWGALATLFNFIPYVGALLGLTVVTAVAVVSIEPASTVVMIALFYFFCTSMEGQFMTPCILGKRLEMNTPALLIAVGFWAFLWGFVGALVAVPLVVIAKTIAEQFPAGQRFAHFLAAPQNDDPA